MLLRHVDILPNTTITVQNGDSGNIFNSSDTTEGE